MEMKLLTECVWKSAALDFTLWSGLFCCWQLFNTPGDSVVKSLLHNNSTRVADVFVERVILKGHIWFGLALCFW